MGRTYKNKDKKFKQRLKENRRLRQTKRRVDDDDVTVRRESNKDVLYNDRHNEFSGEENWNENF